MGEARFAIYFTPAPGSRLATFGASALGYDCHSGAEVARMELAGLDPAAVALAAVEPARYGFHATLMAPFRLRAGASEADLKAPLEALAAARPAVMAPRLEMSMIGGFVVLRPAGSEEGLSLLAAASVEAFDEFRAPLSTRDRERRLAAGLTPRQIELLDRWGYPYVLEEFRFHMTLAGPLPTSLRASWRDALAAAFAAAVDEPLRIDAISLMRQDGPQTRFRVIARAILSGPMP